MALQLLIAQWSGKLPEGFVRPASLQTGLAECKHKRCRNKVAIKRDGTPAHACLCVATHKQATASSATIRMRRCRGCRQ